MCVHLCVWLRVHVCAFPMCVQVHVFLHLTSQTFTNHLLCAQFWL